MPRRITAAAARADVELSWHEIKFAEQLQAFEDLLWTANGREGPRPDMKAVAIESKRSMQGRPVTPTKTPAWYDQELEKLINESEKKVRP